MHTNCVVCNCEVDNWDEVYSENSNVVHPIGGTVFKTYGHYGSTIFDPMDGSFLQIVICDECLKSKMDKTYSGMNNDYGRVFE